MTLALRPLAFAVLVIASPAASLASKPEPPFRSEVKLLEADKARLGSVSEIHVDVTTDVDLEDLHVRFVFPPELALLRGADEWRGALYAGAPLTFVLPVAILEAGEYAFVVKTEAAGWGRRDALNFIVSEKEVHSSTEDPFRMKWNRAPSEEERERLLTGRVEPVILSPEEEPRVDPVLERLFSPYSESSDEGAPESYGIAPRDVRVRARLFYRDFAGTRHPMRAVRVDIVDDDSPGADQLLRTVATNTAGRLDATVTIPDPVDGDGSDVDIKLVIHCAIRSGLVASIGATTATTYQVLSGVTANYAGVDLDLGDLSTGTPVSGGGAGDNLESRRFSTLDAMLQGAAEAFFLRGSFLPRIPVVMPSTVGTSAFCGNDIRPADCAVSPGGQCAAADELHVLNLDAFDWDVLIHEYGHYVLQDGTTADLDDSCGGAHTAGTSTIPAHGKALGSRLAWNEGCATWFSIAAQREQTIALPAIPRAGDLLYEDREDITVTLSIESPATGGEGVGYADELTVMRVLWDIQDTAADTSADSTARDSISLSFTQLWRVLNRDPNNSLPRFWQSVAERAPNTRTLVRAAGVFAMNNAAPEALTPADDTSLSPVRGATFTWARNGDPGAAHVNNEFRLLISKDDWATFSEFGPFGLTSYTVPDAMWSPLFDDAGLDTVYRWVIAGKNTTAPATPAGGTTLSGYFLSQEKRFKPKAIEIKMTWSPVGADVDLHLRPPDGASSTAWNYANDCAYYNLRPDWGVLGDPSDDPALDRDCITSCTEENITLDTVTTPGTYKVLAHYYSDHGLGPATVTVEVKRFGRVVRTATRTLSNPSGTPADGELWTVFTFTRSAFAFSPDGGDPEGAVRSHPDTDRGALLKP